MKRILIALISFILLFTNYSQAFSQDNSVNAVYNAENKLGVGHSGKIIDRMKNVEIKQFGKSNENLSIQERNALIQKKLSLGSSKKVTTPTKTSDKITSKTNNTPKLTNQVVSKKNISKLATKTTIKLKEDYEIVIPPRFDEAGLFSEGLAAVKEGNKWGYINKSGKYVILPQFDTTGGFKEGLAAVSLNNRWTYVNKNGDFLFPAQYDEVFDFSEGLGWVCKDHQCHVINKQGQPITHNKLYVKSLEFGNPECYPKHYFNFSEGFSRVFFDNKTGYIDKKGNLVIRNAFDIAASFSDGLAGVKINHKWGFIDKYGKMIIPPQFDEIIDEDNDVEYQFNNGTAFVYKNNNLILIDKTGKTLLQFNNFAIIDTGSCYAEGLYPAANQKDGKYGFIDSNGNIVIPFKFDFPSRGGCPGFFKDNVAVLDTPVEENGIIKYKVIDKKGKILLLTKHTIQNFSEGLAPIEINGKWGYIANPVNKQSTK